MPDLYFSRPCPNCGGRVRRPDGCSYAECTGCGKRFQLPKPAPEAQPSAPTKNGFFTSVKRFFRAIKAKALDLYRGLYRKIRKKNDRIPLPKPPSDAPKTTPEPPMDAGQRALYNARKRQLQHREDANLPPPEPTRGERIEAFVEHHRRFSIAAAIVAVVLLLALLTVGITFCVKESRINKDKFTLIYGTEGVDAFTDRQTYKFMTNNGKILKINMNAIAELCDLTISGTSVEPKYAVRGGPSYVRFRSGNKVAMVNGRNYEMSCPAEYDDKGNLWVDLYFADDILAGVSITFDSETNTVRVQRNTTDESTVLHPVYTAVSISAGNRTESEDGGFAAEISYKTNVSAYIDDLYPVDPSYLILANKEHPLGEDHVPEDLVTLTVPTTRALTLRASAARALEAMFAEMTAYGLSDVSVTSAYRSYAYQTSLFDHYIDLEMAGGLSYDEAVAVVETYSSRPGYSEHQTGLCVDFWVTGMTDLTNEQFEPTDASAWLMEHAWKFGFVLRYPSDKTDTTGYTYESWHYRFVGVDAATEIHTKGICFEEYLEQNS